MVLPGHETNGQEWPKWKWSIMTIAGASALFAGVWWLVSRNGAHSGRIGHRFRDESAIYRSLATLVASYVYKWPILVKILMVILAQSESSIPIEDDALIFSPPFFLWGLL